MKLKKIHIPFSFLTLLLLSCGGSSGGDDSPPMSGNDDEPEIPAPSSATLVFPEDETECNTGIIDSTDETLSTVTFEWNASTNTDSYTVTVTDLNTNSSVFSNSNTNSADITISRGTPYSWFVTSRAQGTNETANSATFRFYNEGPGIENYAPFPAEAVRPNPGANLTASTSNVTLEWSSTDIDDDLSSYEVFLGLDSDTLTSLGETQENSFPNVSVTSGNTYFWRIISRDVQGNSSESQVFQFRIL